MKIKLSSKANQSGSVLVVALVIGLILGITLASYLLLMSHQNTMVARGQAWNHAMALAEAGVEDALAQLNRAFGTSNPRGGVNGWNGPAAGPATLDAPRTLAGGSYGVVISDGAFPTITSTGRVVVANSSKVIERVVRVRTTGNSLFRVAMAAKRNIVFNGNNIRVDSFDSSDPKYSTGGMYDPAKAKAGGDIASTEGFINVGNADVKGKLYTGPLNSGQYSVGPNGSVGDMSWNGPGIQPGWYFNDFNLEFANVTEPYSTGIPPKSRGTNLWQLGGAEYKYDGNFSANSGTIYVEGKATVYVTGSFTMKGTIIVAPGASLKLYVGGGSTTLNRVNTDGNPNSFQYYGMPGNTSVAWNGNDAYVGTVYAPQATLSMGGGGNNTFDYQGACVVEAVKLNGHFNFHFDENLRRKGPVSGFAVAAWEEL